MNENHAYTKTQKPMMCKSLLYTIHLWDPR